MGKEKKGREKTKRVRPKPVWQETMLKDLKKREMG